MQSWLVLSVELGPAVGQTFDASNFKQITVGRTKVNSFQIKDETISQKHVVIQWKNDEWEVFDVGSSNGTTVNGTDIGVEKPYRLQNKDLIRIGIDTRIRVAIEEKAAPNADETEQVQTKAAISKRNAKAKNGNAKAKKGKAKIACENEARAPDDPTLRDWITQERARLPKRLHEKAEAAIAEIKEYAQQLKMQYQE